MANEVTLSIYQHRHQSHTVRLLASIYEHTRGSVRIDLIQEPGSAHQNLNRALDRCDTQYQVILDDDTVLLQDGWLPGMLEPLLDRSSIGIVGAYCVRKSLNVPPEAGELTALTVPWVPGYITALESAVWRAKGIRFDEAIPGPSQFSDVDVCWQLGKAGLQCVVAPIVVHHPDKEVTADRKRWLGPQCEYMAQKWGAEAVGNIALPQSTALD